MYVSCWLLTKVENIAPLTPKCISGNGSVEPEGFKIWLPEAALGDSAKQLFQPATELPIPEFRQSALAFQSVSDILAEGMWLRDLDRTPTQADVIGAEASVASEESTIALMGVRKRRGTLWCPWGSVLCHVVASENKNFLSASNITPSLFPQY